MPVTFDDQQAPAQRGKVVFDDTPTAPAMKTIQRADENGVLRPVQVSPEEYDRVNAASSDDSPRILPDFDLSDLWATIKGAPETAMSMVNNAGAAAMAGITAPFVGANDDDSANYIRDFTAQNSYHPQGESAKKLSSAIGDAFAPVEHSKQGLGDTLMEATGSPAAATAGYMAPDLATILMGPKAAPEGAPPRMLAREEMTGGPVPAPRTAQRAVPEDPIARARTAGIKVLPSDAERITHKKPGLGDRIAESIAPEGVRREMTLENQKASNQLVREKVKAPDGARLNRNGVEKEKAPHFQTYEDVNDAINIVPPSEGYLFALDDATQAAGFPKGAKPTVTEVISALRTKARRKINNPNADDKLEAEGRLADDAADKLEEAMGTELKNTGQEDLLAKYQSARQSLGELNDVQRSQRGGNIDPQALHKLDKKNPGRMTGQTKLLADVAEDFPDLKSSMTGAGKKGSTGKLTKENIVEKGAKKTARGAVMLADKVSGAVGLPKLGDRLLVESEGFQNRLGKAATPAERSYLDDYGKKPGNENTHGTTNTGDGLQFDPTAGTIPSKAVTLSDHLELEPDHVANPEKLPPKPDILTADTPPRSRGDIEPRFDAQAEADKLAGELGVDIRTHTKGAIGERELSDLLADQGAGDLKTAPPRDMEQLDFTPPVGEKVQNLQLTKSPKGGQKITAARDKAGNITVRHEDGGEITAVENHDQGTMQIKDSKVPAESRGQGRGQAMARQLYAMAKKRGLRLTSDNRVSESAQAMWKALKAKGLKVKQNPATRQASGELVSNSELKPVFEIVDDLVTE